MTEIIDDELRERLLSSIAGNRLIILCGAGLSMAAPSGVSSAWEVAQRCAENYRSNTGTMLSGQFANDIEAMAEHFHGRDEFSSVFISQLIDWTEFVSRKSNLGHMAIADFLEAKVVDLVVSTNVDTLIEQAAKQLGEQDFYPLVRENELNMTNSSHATLLKLHGCADRSRFETVWCKSQLEADPIKSRIEHLAAWLRGHLPNRDLLVVGFWTDWSYLNSVLEAAVVSTEPRSVIVVDPCTKTELRKKSPVLSKWAFKSARFQHVKESGDAFLDEFRHILSRHFIENVWEMGRLQYSMIFGVAPPARTSVDLASLSTDQLYVIRRHLTGTPNTSAVGSTTVEQSHSLIGLLHLGLLFCGAAMSFESFQLENQSLRLIHTPGEALSRVRARFAKEPPNPAPPSRTICVGAWDDGGAPQSIIGRGVPESIIRNVASGSWECHQQLLSEISEALKV